jgi:hypothetical protein
MSPLLHSALPVVFARRARRRKRVQRRRLLMMKLASYLAFLLVF